jgi:hypothetical protein
MTHDEMARIAVRVVAEQCARKRVKELLRQQGVKLSYVTAKDIASQAKAWLAAHPEMIAEARAKAASLGYVSDQGRPTHSHSKGTAEPQSVTEIRLPPLRKGACWIADRGDGTMHEEGVCNFNFDSVLEPPHKWEDVVRHTNACEMLARTEALKQAGSDWPTYFAKHRVRLMSEASQLIARSWVLERWRLTRV